MFTPAVKKQKIFDTLTSLSIVVLLLIFAVELYYIFSIHVWRHDSLLILPYYGSYYVKFVAEGRWLIYLLFPLLSHFPPHLSLLLSFAALFFFSWVCARELAVRRIALIFSLATLQVPAFYSLFGWPLTPLPNYLLLALAAVLAKRLDFRIFFLIFGILFHGAFNNYYNLLPLLYLAQVRNRRIRLSTLLVYYVAGYVAGYVVAQLIVLYVHGTFIQIARWRSAKYIDSISTLVRNLYRIFQSIERHIALLQYPLFIISLIIFCIILPYIQIKISTLRERENMAYADSSFGHCLFNLSAIFYPRSRCTDSDRFSLVFFPALFPLAPFGAS